MPRRAPEAAAVAPAPAAPPKKVRTTAAMDEEARVLVSRRKLAHDAAVYAHEKKVGSKAALKTGKFGGSEVVTYNMVEPLLRQLKQNGKFDDDDRDHHAQILTNNERRKLANWILACVDGHNPKDRVQVSAKIRQILRTRHAYNKKMKVARWRARAASSRARTPSGSGARRAGPRTASARSGRALRRASHSCWATTRRRARRRARRTDA